MVKASYTPAIGEQFNSIWKRQLEYNGYDLKFFTPKSHFQNDIALQSSYYAINGVGKNNNYRDLIKFPKDKLLMGDSGGFQIATFAKQNKFCDLDPLSVLRWLEANCDIGMNLDVPTTLGPEQPTNEQFKKAMNQSMFNFEFFQKNRNPESKLKLYNVLHGENLEHMNLWYQNASKYKFEGWAIGVKPPYDAMSQALGAMFLWEKGELNDCYGLHFFGTSGKHVVPTITYLAHKFKKKMVVSYDSSSYNIGSIYRTYYMPFELGKSLSFGDKFARANPEIETLPCMCPVCQSITDVKILNGGDIYAGGLISLHNMYQYINYNNLLNSIVPNSECFKAYLKDIQISDRTLTSFDFIDFAFERGVAKAVEKYKGHFNVVKEQVKQTGIWGF